jgi:cell division protein FtsL
MNAAVRALTHGIAVVTTPAKPIIISAKYIFIGILLLAVLISALSIVYVTDLNRHQFSDLQTSLQARDDLNTQYGQLLLEQNTWSSPARVQQISQQQFNMNVPAPQAVVMVHQ